MSADLAELLSLPGNVRLEIAEALWRSVDEEGGLELPEEHRRILEERLADYESGRVQAISHEELMNRLSSL